jgi:hypothetical protein
VIRSAFLPALALASCASHLPAATRGAPPRPTSETVYASFDLRRIIVFSEQGVRFGPLLDYVNPPDATRYFEPSGGVQCVSIGIPGNTVEYAIKRPIRAGERYQCGRTSFRVVRCLADCRAAIIEYDKRLADNLGAPEGYLYVNSCRGIIAFSDVTDPSQGIPLSAELLRGDVGILPDPSYPDCRWF